MKMIGRKTSLQEHPVLSALVSYTEEKPSEAKPKTGLSEKWEICQAKLWRCYKFYSIITNPVPYGFLVPYCIIHGTWQFIHVCSEWKNIMCSFLRIPVALLTGSDYSASCKRLQWLATVANCNKVCKDVAWLIIYTWANMNFFRILVFSPPAFWEALLLIYLVDCL